MSERSEALSKDIEGNNEACCIDGSCCPSKTLITRNTSKIGRNNPCICGNGRKIKKYCGKNI
jgi:hypothetical protein